MNTFELETICERMNNEPDYAYGWFANISMTLVDTGIELDLARECAAKIMRHCFQFDVPKCFFEGKIE